jgi:hypothetical protein
MFDWMKQVESFGVSSVWAEAQAKTVRSFLADSFSKNLGKQIYSREEVKRERLKNVFERSFFEGWLCEYV